MNTPSTKTAVVASTPAKRTTKRRRAASANKARKGRTSSSFGDSMVILFGIHPRTGEICDAEKNSPKQYKAGEKNADQKIAWRKYHVIKDGMTVKDYNEAYDKAIGDTAYGSSASQLIYCTKKDWLYVVAADQVTKTKEARKVASAKAKVALKVKAETKASKKAAATAKKAEPASEQKKAA